MNDRFMKLMLVTHKRDRPLAEYLDFIATCARSGLTSVQLRDKDMTFDELITFGQQLQRILQPLNVPLIINDNLELALQLQAEGIHLGQTDGDVLEARKQLGSNKIIGLSVEILEQIDLANELPVDYIGVGTIFPTKSKPDVKTIWGCDGLRQASERSKHPIIAIGGIDTSNAAEVMKAGAHGLAAIGVFQDSENREETTKLLLNIVSNKHHESCQHNSKLS